MIMIKANRNVWTWVLYILCKKKQQPNNCKVHAGLVNNLSFCVCMMHNSWREGALSFLKPLYQYRGWNNSYITLFLKTLRTTFQNFLLFCYAECRSY